MKEYDKDMDPLEILMLKYGFDRSQIDRLVSGQKYTAIMLKNGRIGLCANLGNKISTNLSTHKEIDLKNISSRIVLNAYFAALLNYHDSSIEGADIFDDINFSHYQNVVMVGYFKSLISKFELEKIPLKIFDLRRIDDKIIPISDQEKQLKTADAIILSSTTIFNRTFNEIINASPSGCDIYLLGPSSIMAHEILEYKNIKKIYGATFAETDTKVIEIIQNDGGTKDFLKYQHKKIYQ